MKNNFKSILRMKKNKKQVKSKDNDIIIMSLNKSNLSPFKIK